MAKKKNFNTYVVLHLDTTKLKTLKENLALGESVTEDDQMAVDQWFKMRVPSANAKNKDTVEGVKAVDDLPRTRAKAYATLSGMGFYTKVATVEAADKMSAYRMTTNFKGIWYLSDSVEINTGENKTLRETNTNDVIMDADNPFLVMPLGFIDINETLWN